MIGKSGLGGWETAHPVFCQVKYFLSILYPCLIGIN